MYDIDKFFRVFKFLQDKGAIIILISHLGEDGSQSLAPVAAILKKYIKNSQFIKTPILLQDTEDILDKLKSGDVVLLENIRREIGEKKNDVSFARGLSRLGQFYVNEAFSVSHREHASIIGLPKFLPCYAGLQMEKEIKELSLAFVPKHPFLFIVGGAKFETKIPLLKKFLKV